MRNVLILEDDEITQSLFLDSIWKKVNLLQAYDLKEAEILFNENKNTLDIIALDWQVPCCWSTFKNTVELARHIKNDFNWEIYSLALGYEVKKEFEKIWFEKILNMKYEFVKIILDIIEKDNAITI
jgi:hypothetical protein